MIYWMFWVICTFFSVKSTLLRMRESVTSSSWSLKDCMCMPGTAKEVKTYLHCYTHDCALILQAWLWFSVFALYSPTWLFSIINEVYKYFSFESRTTFVFLFSLVDLIFLKIYSIHSISPSIWIMLFLNVQFMLLLYAHSFKISLTHRVRGRSMYKTCLAYLLIEIIFCSKGHYYLDLKSRN